MWGVVRARCVPSVHLATSWLCVVLLRVLSLLLATVALLLGNSCHPHFSLSCTQLVILTFIQAIASVLGQQLQLLSGESGGLVMPTRFIVALQVYSRYLYYL